jgi:hypothetical protein
MSRKSKRPRLNLTDPDRQQLESLAQSTTAPYREVQRAKIILAYHAGHPFTEIAKQTGTTRRIVYKCVDKALSLGVDAALQDLPRPGAQPVITPADKAWVVHLACSKPKDLGYAAEFWTRQSLADHVRRQAEASDHPALRLAAKATIQRILDEQDLQPHRIEYYLERRDPEFETKMREVLLVYQEVSLAPAAGVKTEAGEPVFTVSVDEKPGVQAIGNTAPDLPPVAGEHAPWSRDHEYVRMGTASILAGLDLQDGHVFARVERRHRSREFIGLLADLDTYYPAGAQIRIILDNHSAHISKETRRFLASKPNRFHYVHTPKHGSWLNLVETLFGKMARTFLRAIRVESWQELKERILRGVQEINVTPVIHRWKKFDALKTQAAAA